MCLTSGFVILLLYCVLNHSLVIFFHIVCDHVTSEICFWTQNRGVHVRSFHLSAFCGGKDRKKEKKRTGYLFVLFFGACNIRSAAYHWVFVSALSGVLRKFKFNDAERPQRP